MIYLIIPLSLAVFDWIALAANWKRIDNLLKPATMVALITWTWFFPSGGHYSPTMNWIRIGLLFSLLGDVLLLPTFDQFLGGLSAFLLGHCAYIRAFIQSPPPLNLQAARLILPIIVGAWIIGRRLQKDLTTGPHEKLRLPLLVYSVVITGMLVSAWSTTLRPDWPAEAAWLVATGATLFALSDSLLAWNRFVSPLPKARLLVRFPYHLGQIGLALGAGLS